VVEARNAGRPARAFYDRTLAWPHIAAAYAALLQ